MNDSIKEKIVKLLALSESSNPHEAALAMQRAKEIMYKHGIAEADMRRYIEISDVVEILLFSARRRPKWKHIIAGAVTEYFDCVIVCRKWLQNGVVKHNVNILGVRDSALCAQICFDYLAESMPAGLSWDYRNGFALGVLDQVRELKAQESKGPTGEYSLMAISKAESAVSHLKKLKGPQVNYPKEEKDFMEGFKVGKETSISRQINKDKHQAITSIAVNT